MPKVTQKSISGYGDITITDEHRQTDESEYDHRYYVEAISTPSYDYEVEKDIIGIIRV